jgi:hypothetical protein
MVGDHFAAVRALQHTTGGFFCEHTNRACGYRSLHFLLDWRNIGRLREANVVFTSQKDKQTGPQQYLRANYDKRVVAL